jgi:hypothetical protein
MERRDFLKLASMAGLGVVVAGPLAGRASAADPYTGKLFLFVHAGGGWDPTSFCDPKGANGLNDTDPMNTSYLATDIATAGAAQGGVIRYAPVGGNGVFFEKWWNSLCVINGVDTGTNSHDAGTRTTWCGTLKEGKPSFGALVAAVYGATQPMAYISNGGYDYTANAVSITRVPDTGVLQAIAYPNQMFPGAEDSPLYHTEGTIERISAAREARYNAKLATQRLPKLREDMSTLYAARLGSNELKKLIDYLPAQFAQGQLERQAQVAIAAYKAGICVAANLSIGGFDTHGGHDAAHIPRLADIWTGVDFIMEYAATEGIAQQVVLVMGSDFGRTPGYNGGQGKDHWNITSMMMMGAGIPGNRVIGATDERHNPLNIDPATMQVSGGGVRITPGHVHKALRKLAGIDTAEVVQRYPLAEEEDINFFG